MIKRKSFKKGFSLVELMIVIAIMAILATVSFFAYTSFQKGARDAKRKSDLSSLGTALQAYYADNSAYPVSPVGGAGTADTVATTPTLTAGLAKYGGSVPKAPAAGSMTGNNVTYQYVSHDAAGTYNGTTFSLCAQLEDQTLAGSCTTAPCMVKVTSSDLSGSIVDNAVCVAP